jgi:hypothetical protein
LSKSGNWGQLAVPNLFLIGGESADLGSYQAIVRTCHIGESKVNTGDQDIGKIGAIDNPSVDHSSP